MEDFQKLFDDPMYIKEQQKKARDPVKMTQHTVGLVNKGHILGIEEATFGIAETYNTSAQCVSLKAELFMIDREYFIKTLQT